MGRPGRKRLSVDLPIKLHELLKEVSRARNAPITKLVIRAILEYLPKQNRG